MRDPIVTNLNWESWSISKIPVAPSEGFPETGRRNASCILTRYRITFRLVYPPSAPQRLPRPRIPHPAPSRESSLLLPQTNIRDYSSPASHLNEENQKRRDTSLHKGKRWWCIAMEMWIGETLAFHRWLLVIDSLAQRKLNKCKPPDDVSLLSRDQTQAYFRTKVKLSCATTPFLTGQCEWYQDSSA
jgi:hypothetical protein